MRRVFGQLVSSRHWTHPAVGRNLPLQGRVGCILEGLMRQPRANGPVGARSKEGDDSWIGAALPGSRRTADCLTRRGNVQSTLPLGPCAPAKERSAPSYTVEVASSFEEISLDSVSWDKHVASLGGSVYMTWDWLRTWWQFYGEGSTLRLIV